VGQRSGLGLSGPDPRFVVRLDPVDNAVIVGGADEVCSRDVVVGAMTWTRETPVAPLRAEVRVRHRHTPALAIIEPGPDKTASIRFDEPQRAPAPGQAAVIYAGDEVLGGGTILRSTGGGS
jgi:tRNA-specific 2-thiouridylase